MKLFLLGKRAGITGWLEDAFRAWRLDGHQVRVGFTRNPAVNPAIEALMLAPRLGAPMAARLARAVAVWDPDLIVAIGAYHVPIAILERVAALPGRAPMIGWVGDLFDPEARLAACLFDQVAYTDSGLVQRHQSLGFASPALYLPHAVDPHVTIAPRRRTRSMVFVANPTDHRREVIAGLKTPVALYGPGWTRTSAVGHEIHPGRVKPGDLLGLYASHLAALNIRNEHNVLSGLNQRNFAPYLAGTVVVSDSQPDLGRCFEPGREVLAWRHAAELEDLYARLRSDPAEAAAIGERGRRRVLADHTYARRLEALNSRP